MSFFAHLHDSDDCEIKTNGEFTKEEIDMFSLVMIGNSKSFVQDGFFVTPRGYSL